MGDYNDKSNVTTNSNANAEHVAGNGSEGVAIAARPYANADGSEDIPNGCEESFPYIGIINTAYTVRLHSNSELGIKNTMADLPKGTQVSVVGAKHNMLKIEVGREGQGLTVNKRGENSSDGSILTGYVSQELVRSANPQANYCEEHPYVDKQLAMTVVPEHLLKDEVQFDEKVIEKEFEIDGGSFSENQITKLIKAALMHSDSNTLSSANLKFKFKFGALGTAALGFIEAGGGIILGMDLNCGIGDSRGFSASITKTVGTYGEASVLWGLVEGEISKEWQSKQTIATSTIEKFSAIVVKQVLDEILKAAILFDTIAKAEGVPSNLSSTALDLHKKNAPKGREKLNYTTVDTSSETFARKLSGIKNRFGYEDSEIKYDQHFKSGDKERKSNTTEDSKAIFIALKNGLGVKAKQIDKTVKNHANSDNDGSYTDYEVDFEVHPRKIKKLKKSLAEFKQVLGSKKKIDGILDFLLDGIITPMPSMPFSAAAKIKLQIGFSNEGEKSTHLYTRVFIGTSASASDSGSKASPGAVLAGVKAKYDASASFDNQKLIMETLGTDTLAYLSLVHNGLMGRDEKDKPEEAWTSFKSKHRSELNEMVKKVRTGELDINQFSRRSLDIDDFNLADLEVVLDEMQSYKKMKSM